MVRSCAVVGCTNRYRRDSGIHFFSFPFRRNEVLKKWVRAIKRKNFIPNIHHNICSVHFEQKDFQHNPGSYKKKLKEHAVPSVFPECYQKKPNRLRVTGKREGNDLIELNFCESGIRTRKAKATKNSDVIVYEETEELTDQNEDEVSGDEDFQEDYPNSPESTNMEEHDALNEQPKLPGLNTPPLMPKTEEILEEEEEEECEQNVYTESTPIEIKVDQPQKYQPSTLRPNLDDPPPSRKHMSSQQRHDLFKQPFVLSYLSKYLRKQQSNTSEPEDVTIETSDGIFVDDASICRCCMKADPSSIYKKLFQEQQQDSIGTKKYLKPMLTSIGIKMTELMGDENVQEDLLPQQICLVCAEQVAQAYETKKLCAKSHELLSSIVESFRQKKIMFHMENSSQGLSLTMDKTTYAFTEQNTCINKFFDVNKEADSIMKDRPNIIEEISIPCVEEMTNEDIKDLYSNELKRLKLSRERSRRYDWPRVDMNPLDKCHFCGKIFPSAEPLIQHITCFHANATYECLFCSERFSSLEDLCSHIKESEECQVRHTEEDKDPGYIPNQNKAIDTVKLKQPYYRNKRRYVVLKHLQMIRNKGKIAFSTCKECDHVFRASSSEEYIKSHILLHLYEKVDANTIDVETLDISQYLTLTLGYPCVYCLNPKSDLNKMKIHFESCLKFSVKCGLPVKMRIRKNAGSIRTCRFCTDGIEYPRKQILSHMKENHPEHLHVCRHCKQSFVYQTDLHRHVSSQHLGKPIEPQNIEKRKVKTKQEYNIMCEHCSRVCKTKAGYNLHVQQKHLKKKLSTNIRERLGMKRQRRNIINKKDYETIQCDICNKKLFCKIGSRTMEFHKMKHDSPSGKVECCNKEFDGIEKYLIHMSSHRKSWECSICNIKLDSAILWRNHRRQEHCTCQECGHVSKTVDKFIQHTTEVHGGLKPSQIKHDDMTYLKQFGIQTCEYCGETFQTRKTLDVHIKQYHWTQHQLTGGSVSNKRKKAYGILPSPVVCCGKVFTKDYNLKLHQVKHQDTACKKCGDILKSKLALISHNATHHRDHVVQCEYCNKTLVSMDSYKVHVITHTKGRQLQCPCGLKFYQESDMKKHQLYRKTPCLGGIINYGRMPEAKKKKGKRNEKDDVKNIKEEGQELDLKTATKKENIDHTNEDLGEVFCFEAGDLNQADDGDGKYETVIVMSM